MTDNERAAQEPGVVPDEEDRGDVSPVAKGNPRQSTGSRGRIVLWALVSLALLAFVALGSTPAYIWRFGRKHQEFKPVLRIWTTEANDLPQVSQQWIVDSTYYAALIVFLIGVVVGLWFLLGAADDGTAASDAVSSADAGTTAS